MSYAKDRMAELKAMNLAKVGKKAVGYQLPPGLSPEERYIRMARDAGVVPPAKGERQSWQFRLDMILRNYGSFRLMARGVIKQASYPTLDARRQVLFQCFNQLWEMGFKVQDPANLDQRHVKALVSRWIADDLSAATIQARLTPLRLLCQWLGKTKVVLDTAAYATTDCDLKRTGVAVEDKSWSGADIDFDDVLKKAFDEDVNFGLQLMVIGTFGLRVKEAVMFAINDSDRDGFLWIEHGAKGGLGRRVPVESPSQVAVVEMVKAYVRSRPARKHLGRLGDSLKQSMYRFYYLARRLGISQKAMGVTAHGLRHEYCHQLMMDRGLIPPVKGGGRNQMSDAERIPIQMYTSRTLGHSRVSVTAAYAGSFHRMVLTDAAPAEPTLVGKSTVFKFRQN